MAKTKNEVKRYKVKSPIENYQGIGAGGVHFAYGEAEVNEGWVLDWYREKGYTVEEIKEVETTPEK